MARSDRAPPPARGRRPLLFAAVTALAVICVGATSSFLASSGAVLRAPPECGLAAGGGGKDAALAALLDPELAVSWDWQGGGEPCTCRCCSTLPSLLLLLLLQLLMLLEARSTTQHPGPCTRNARLPPPPLPPLNRPRPRAARVLQGAESEQPSFSGNRFAYVFYVTSEQYLW